MSIIDDALKSFDELCVLLKDFGSSTLNFTTQFIYGGKVKYTSLESKTKDVTAIFPNIVDKSLSLSNVEKINRCVEVKNSNLLRLLLTNIAKQSIGDDAEKILKKFHRNFDDSDFMDFVLSEEVTRYNTDKLISNYSISMYENSRIINPSSLNNNYYTCNNNVIHEDFFDRLVTSFNGSNKGFSGKPINSSSKFSDNDVRIINNLSPLMIETSVPTSYNGVASIVTLLFGVKSKIYPATQDELIDVISINKRKSRLFKLIQFSTGEIKFFKDLVFNIDYVKEKVGNNTDKTNDSRVKKLWKILEKRSKNRKSYRFNDMDNASIATLTISTNTVEEIERVKKFNLLDPKVASKFIEENNIMNLFIVDEISEIVYIMSDSDRSFIEMTFEFLDKELTDIGSQKTLKKGVSYFG